MEQSSTTSSISSSSSSPKKMNIRISHGSQTKVLVIKEGIPLVLLIPIIAKKLGLKKVYRLYDHFGLEVTDVSGIKDGELLVASSNPQRKPFEKPKRVKKNSLCWAKVKAGRICLFHRPGRRLLNRLHSSGVTHVITLQCEKEGGNLVGASVLKQNLKWISLPLLNANLPSSDMLDAILTGIKQMCCALEDGGSLFIHCSAGLHRTGMISNALLQFLGFNEVEALEIMTKTRPLTAIHVGAKRLLFAKTFLETFGTWEDHKNDE